MIVQQPRQPKVVEDPNLVIMGSLSSEAILTTIEANRAEIDQCWVAGVDEAMEKATVRFVIGADGAVTRATVWGSDEDHQAAFDCMVKEIESWIFGPPDGGGTVIVTYPF